MKKALIFILIGVLLGAAASWAFMRYVVPRWRPSHVDNTFWEVTSRLDKGGEVFAYLHAEQVTQAVREAMEGLRKNVGLMPDEQRDKAGQSLNLAGRVFESYGLDEISGLGLSSFSIRPGLHRVRVVLHHRPGRNQGLIWNAFGTTPRVLDELDLLPNDTALAFSRDADIAGLIEWASRAGSQVNGPGEEDAEDTVRGPTPDQVAAMMKMGLQAAGIDYDKLIASYGGRIGWLLTLDTEKRVALPAGEKPFLIPEPAFALFVRVNDDYLFDAIGAKMTGSDKPKIIEENGLRKIIFPPVLAPFPVEPVVARKGGWLVAASRLSLLEDMLAGRGPRLAGSKAFKEIAARLPRKGNGFGYVGPRLTRSVAQALRENMTDFPAPAALARIAMIFEQTRGMCQVWENTDQGIVYTINHGFDVSTLPELVEALVDIAGKTAKTREKTVPAAPEEKPSREERESRP